MKLLQAKIKKHIPTYCIISVNAKYDCKSVPVGGNTSSSVRNKMNRFKSIVEHNGQRKVYSLIAGVVKDKLVQLSGNAEMANFLSNTYTWKNAKKRVCLSCGRDITNQHKNSRFCSAKYVGEREAKQCSNSNINLKNNRRRKIERIVSKGVLFDITPYIVKKGKRRGKRA